MKDIHKKWWFWTIIIVIVLAIATIIFIQQYKKKNPGVWFKYKCDQGGDDTSQFYGENWQARGAVCDGLYIPFGVSLKGKDKIKVLSKMGELYANDNTLKEDMKYLSQMAIEQS